MQKNHFFIMEKIQNTESAQCEASYDRIVICWESLWPPP